MKKVVLLGDSIRLIGYGKRVVELLGDQCTVWQPEDNCRFAKYTLRMLFDEQQNIKNADVIHWNFEEAIRKPAPTGIEIAGKPRDFILKDGCHYYLFCYDLPMVADPNVALNGDEDYESKFRLPEKIRTVCWMDNGGSVSYQQDGQDVIVHTKPYRYGRSLVVRVAKITVEK